jgi:hypothetical protein
VVVDMLSGYDLDRPVFHKNDILKQKRAAAYERMNLKYTKGEMLVRLIARHREEWEEGKGKQEADKSEICIRGHCLCVHE